ncbi:MAG TPA: hypothetical protein VL463_06780 [Kofleriaceae bacterium]|nr:hypothetical protein [Kofleriaceae bacterium]
MKKRNASSLRLATQTVRNLSTTELAHANGGSLFPSIGSTCSGPTTRGLDGTTVQSISLVSLSGH